MARKFCGPRWEIYLYLENDASVVEKPRSLCNIENFEKN